MLALLWSFLVFMGGKADGQDFFWQKQSVSIFFCSITCFWVHDSEYKHLIPCYWIGLVILFCSFTNKNRLMTKKSNKCHSIIYSRNTYTEEQNEHHRSLYTKVYYMSFWAIWLVHSFLYFDFILHCFTFYGAFNLLILHGFTFYGGFDWFVSSLWSTAVLQIDAAQLTLLAVMLHTMDSWIKLQFEKFTQTVAETALKCLLLSYLSSFVYIFKLHWFSTYFQEVHPLAHAN